MLNNLRKLYIIVSSMLYLIVLVFLVYAFTENTKFSKSLLDAIFIYIISSVMVFIGCLIPLFIKMIKPS